MTIYFHHLRSNKTLLFIEELHDKRSCSSIKSDLRLMSYFHEFKTKFTSCKTCLQSNNKYKELSYCLMKLSHFSCQQLISPEIVTIFLMCFFNILVLLCMKQTMRCIPQYPRIPPPLLRYCQYLYLFVAMSTVLIFETFYCSNIIV